MHSEPTISLATTSPAYTPAATEGLTPDLVSGSRSSGRWSAAATAVAFVCLVVVGRQFTPSASRADTAPIQGRVVGTLAGRAVQIDLRTVEGQPLYTVRDLSGRELVRNLDAMGLARLFPGFDPYQLRANDANAALMMVTEPTE